MTRFSRRFFPTFLYKMTFSHLLKLPIPALLLLGAGTGVFAEPDKDDPAAELASFKLPPGFQANLFASEKDGVIKPIQMRWDTRGRLWVIQSTTYPQLVPGEVPNDKVLILEDTTGAGKADKVTVFADGLMIPTGLEIAPTSFGAFAGALLVGNFGDGWINAFDPTTGAYKGPLTDSTGAPIAIQDLWGLLIGNNSAGSSSSTVYFTAGLQGQAHGLFGAIAPIAGITMTKPAPR